jgi:multiple sugar transport system substrate-binding protein
MPEPMLRVRLSRRALVERLLIVGIGSSLSAAIAACQQGPATQAPATTPGNTTQASTTPSAQRPFTPTFYQWIINLHPDIEGGVNKDFAAKHPIDAKIAPVQGFGIERFVAEAKDKYSTWDVYVGMTPFVEMAQLIEADVIEPWDPYMPNDVKTDIVTSVLNEVSYQGKIWSWPFLLDVIVLGWHAGIVQKAGLDPEAPPKTWDELIAAARKIKQTGAAPFGCTFDAHGWRSLAPITHSFSTDVYTEDGLFNFTHDATVQALEVMKQMFELANPDVLNPGKSDAGVNDTPDEGAFAAEQVGYYVKYQNAPIRFAGTWRDPSQLRLGALPSGGAGATVFWTTGAALFRWGQNKQVAAEYMKALTYDERIWRHSIGGGREAVGQLPIYQSLWNKWRENPPEWMQRWAFFVFDQLKVSKAITTHKFGLKQFLIGQPYWEKYFKGEVKDPRTALQQAMDAVRNEIKKQS